MNRPKMKIEKSEANMIADTDPKRIKAVFESQLKTSIQWRVSTSSERIQRIKALRDSIITHREELYQAFLSDYHKPRMEVDGTEIIPTLNEARHNLGHLKKWMRPVKVRPTQLTFGNRGFIQYQPRGRCLIIAPWNYPLYLMFGPLISALAAGNTVILKPSEMAPKVAAIMAKIIREIFHENEVALFEGGLTTSQELLALPFDHIFFTGSPSVGKVVMAAASKNLTSVTLELGGKSPTIVDETADIIRAAETIMWAKFINSGQTCVAPDHLYIHNSIKDKFLLECKRILIERYGKADIDRANNPDFTHIINKHHTERLALLLNDALARGARILEGGTIHASKCYISPTLVDCIPSDASIMSEEIFGPILPIIDYQDLDTVVEKINTQPKPLALYIWSSQSETIQRITDNTSSGGVGINQCMIHVAHGNLPFGGVNNSGIGSAHGIFGFKAFSHERGVLKSTRLNTVKIFFPPYTKPRSRMVGLLAAWLSK